MTALRYQQQQNSNLVNSFLYLQNHSVNDDQQANQKQYVVKLLLLQSKPTAIVPHPSAQQQQDASAAAQQRQYKLQYHKNSRMIWQVFS